MGERLYGFGNKAVLVIFNLFIFLSLYFAITSHNFILGDNHFFGTSTTSVTLIALIGLFIIVILSIIYDGFRKFCAFIFVQHKYVTSFGLLLAVVLFQVFFVLNFHPAIGFDPGAIHSALTNTTDPEIRAYFSLNSNNLFILLFQHQLSILFAHKSWLFFDFVTLFWVNLSAVFNFLCIWIIDKKKLATTIYIHAIWLFLFPMIVIPYTDTWVLPFVSAYVLIYCLYARSNNLIIKYSLAIVFGVIIILSYFMKPSSIIGVIAILLVEFIFQLRGEKKKKDLLVLTISLILFMVSGSITYKGVDSIFRTQNYIKVDSSKAIPAIHFVNMGVTGDGGYNASDAKEMGKLPTKVEKIKYSETKLIERLKERGFFGYLSFLVRKQSNNTSDGTFSWLKEGHFIIDSQAPSGKGITLRLEQFYYLYGNNIADFRFLAQLWWMIWLAILAFGWRSKDKINQILRLAIIGGFLFLLIFEGGRSRYLIQFLPFFLLLASNSFESSVNTFKRLFTWKQKSYQR